MPKNKRLHFKDLNALRAIALIPIFLFCILFQINSSQTGILYDVTLLIGKIAANSLDFFFFLSAFLITSHGLREYKYIDNFSLKNFLFRRALRLGSVLFFGLLFTFLIHPWLIEVLDLHKITFPSKEPYFFLIPNFLSDFTGHQLLYLSIICSIYMFIQLYVLWGLVMRFLSNQLLIISVLMVLVGIVVRVGRRIVTLVRSIRGDRARVRRVVVRTRGAAVVGIHARTLGHGGGGIGGGVCRLGLSLGSQSESERQGGNEQGLVHANSPRV